MSGKAARRKGHGWERKVANLFGDAGYPGRRQWQRQEGHANPDVLCPPFWLECKAQKQPNIRAAYAQAVADCPDECVPAAVTKRDRETPLISLSLKDFLELVRRNAVVGGD